MTIKRAKSQDGSLLLMSLLILSGLLATGSTVGLITAQNLRQAKEVDFSVISFYAAESGVEDGLYEIRKRETAVGSLAPSGVLTNGAGWTRTAAATANVLSRSIAKNDSWQIDLYNPDASLSALGAPIKSLSIAWTGPGTEWLSVQIAPWPTSGVWPSPPVAPNRPSTQLFSAAINPAVVNLQDAANVLYRLRIKALYADVANVTVRAYQGLDNNGGAAPIPAQLAITATGDYKTNKQALRASMPQRPPLSGVFGYVLFSEEDLIKQ